MGWFINILGSKKNNESTGRITIDSTNKWQKQNYGSIMKSACNVHVSEKLAAFIEDSSRFWCFFLEEADAGEIRLLKRLLDMETQYSIIGCFYLESHSGWGHVRGFMVFKRLQKRSRVTHKFGLISGLNIWPAHGSVKERVNDCQAGDWFWQSGKLKL